MDNLVKVEGYGQVKKDLSNGSIISTDRSGFEAFKRRREREANTQERIEALEEQLGRLEGSVERILDILTK